MDFKIIVWFFISILFVILHFNTILFSKYSRSGIYHQIKHDNPAQINNYLLSAFFVIFACLVL